MKNYLITVTIQSKSKHLSYDTLNEIRLNNVSENYLEAFIAGVKASHNANCTIHKLEI